MSFYANLVFGLSAYVYKYIVLLYMCMCVCVQVCTLIWAHKEARDFQMWSGVFD